MEGLGSSRTEESSLASEGGVIRIRKDINSVVGGGGLADIGCGFWLRV